MLDRRVDPIAGFALRRGARDRRRVPLIEARRRCANLPGVRFEQMFVPGQWPDGGFDLILLSEVVYYLNHEDVSRLAARVMSSLARGGCVILVHWIGSTDYPLSGDEAVGLFIERMGSSCIVERSGTTFAISPGRVSRA